ncbi:MAG: hypothetical protein ACLRQF_20365 [Thomasclavelia ramosa]
MQILQKTSRQVIEVNQISGYSQRNYTPYFIINDDMTYYGDHYEVKPSKHMDDYT